MTELIKHKKNLLISRAMVNAKAKTIFIFFLLERGLVVGSVPRHSDHGRKKFPLLANLSNRIYIN